MYCWRSVPLPCGQYMAIFLLTILDITNVLVIIIIIMKQYEENIFFAAEEAELDLCEEWRDWKNDAKSPKDLFPLRDFNKNPNCLFSRNVHLSFILSLLFFTEVPNTLKVKEERDLKVWNCRFYLFTKFIEVMIGLFYKIQSNQTLYLTLSRWSEQIQFFPLAQC